MGAETAVSDSGGVVATGVGEGCGVVATGVGEGGDVVATGVADPGEVVGTGVGWLMGAPSLVFSSSSAPSRLKPKNVRNPINKDRHPTIKIPTGTLSRQDCSSATLR